MAKKSDVLWSTFTGEFVEILCEFVSGDDKHLPLTVQGYLLDMDDDYYFIGEGPIEINAAVKKKNVAFMSILDPESKEQDLFKEVLEDMGMPESDEELN